MIYRTSANLHGKPDWFDSTSYFSCFEDPMRDLYIDVFAGHSCRTNQRFQFVITGKVLGSCSVLWFNTRRSTSFVSVGDEERTGRKG